MFLVGKYFLEGGRTTVSRAYGQGVTGFSFLSHAMAKLCISASKRRYERSLQAGR